MSDVQHETGLAGRYANAILELAQEQKAVENVERDFALLKSLIAGNPDLARLVSAPVFSRDDQAKGMRAVLERTGACPLATQIVLTLAAKRRLFALADIIRAFENLLARQRGEVHAKVTSARPLTDSQSVELKAALKAKLGRDPKIETRVDPSLLGGLIVQVGSRMVDSSLRTKLNGIRLAMRGG